ncbi:uncharacterized protein Tco025E_08231, partial [Trypanosoma conorhini]
RRGFGACAVSGAAASAGAMRPLVGAGRAARHKAPSVRPALAGRSAARTPSGRANPRAFCPLTEGGLLARRCPAGLPWASRAVVAGARPREGVGENAGPAAFLALLFCVRLARQHMPVCLSVCFS